MYLWEYKYLKSVAHTSEIDCDEMVFFIDIVATKMANTIATNITSTTSTSINSHWKKLRDCYTLHSFIFFTFDNYHDLLSLWKTKITLMHRQYKMENNEFK